MLKNLIYILSCTVLFFSCSKDTDKTPLPGPNDPSISAFLPVSGPMGSEVRIAGRSFSTDKDKNIIKFNGTVAQVVEASVNELKVIVPDGATTGKLSVTVNGKSTTSANEFTVTGAQLVI